MLEESKVDENEDFMTRTIRKGMRGAALGASRLADKLGFTQEDVYKDKTKEELAVKKRKGGSVGYKAGGYVRAADGCVKRGKTRGKMV